MKQKIVIIGHGYTSRLGIIRSLASLDCEITVIAIVFRSKMGRLVRFQLGNPIDCYSKYVKSVFTCRGGDEKGLVDLLLNRCSDPRQKVIIIPDSDYSAAVVDKYHKELGERFLYPCIPGHPGEVEHWMDKTVQKSLALEVGLNVAGGHVISARNRSYVIPEGIEYPCFTKPLATIKGGKSFLRKCNGEKDLKSVMDRFCVSFDGDILAEDYKTIEKEYAVVGFSDGKSVIMPGIIEFIENSKSHFGIAREGKILPVAGFEGIVDQFKRFILRIGFYGLFDIDFYQSGGKLYFGELNLRFGGSGYSYTAMGANLPLMFVRSLLGEGLDGMNMEVKEEATYVNERMCMDDYLKGFIDEKEFREIISKRDIRFIDDESDPVPYRRMNKEFRILKLKRLRLQIKRRVSRARAQLAHGK